MSKRIVIGVPTEIEIDGMFCGQDCPLRWPARSRCAAFNELPYKVGDQIVQEKGTALLWSHESGKFHRCVECLSAEYRETNEIQHLQVEVKRLRTWLRLIHKTDKGYQDLCWDFARKALHGNKPPKE